MSQEKKGTIDPTDPSHYKSGKIQVWDFIVDQGLDFLEGNVVKYVCRWRKKDGIKDLIKARTYIEKLIDIAEAEAEEIKVGDTVRLICEESYGAAHGYKVGELAIVTNMEEDTIEVAAIPNGSYINGRGNINPIWSHKKSSWEKVK